MNLTGLQLDMKLKMEKYIVNQLMKILLVKKNLKKYLEIKLLAQDKQQYLLL